MTTLPLWKKKCNKYQSGQALLIILLVLSVVLTVSLSVVSRSVTDISISTLEEESVRALSAAEAGIEQALITGGTVVGDLPSVADPLSSFNAVVTDADPILDPITSRYEFAYPKKLSSGESGIFWLVSHDTDGQLICGGDCFTGGQVRFYWGEPGASPIPAIEVSVYYDTTQAGISPSHDFSSINIGRDTYDPDLVRILTNNFNKYLDMPGVWLSQGPYTIAGKQYNFRGRMSFAACPDCVPVSCSGTVGCTLMLKVRMFYNSTPQSIAITTDAANVLPAQGIMVDSTGTSGEATRRINVFQSYATPPLVFDSSFFSYTSLTK